MDKLTPEQIYQKNYQDADRGLKYLEQTEGTGKAVVRHALIAIRTRNLLALGVEEKEKR